MGSERGRPNPAESENQYLHGMPEWISNYLIPLLLGVGASMVGWFALQHWLRPKLKISPEISRLWVGKGEPRYRFKVMNERKWRAAIDLEVDAYLWLPGFHERRKATTGIVHLKTNKVLAIPPKANRLFTIDLRPAERRFEAAGKAFNPLSLESMLSGGQLRLWVIATDSYSGHRRAFRARYAGTSTNDRLWKPESLELDGSSLASTRDSGET